MGEDDVSQKDKEKKAEAISQGENLLVRLQKAKASLEKGALNIKEDQASYDRIYRKLYEDTNGELTQNEYETLTHVQMFLEKWQEYEQSTEVEALNPDLQQQARLYRNLIIDVMRNYRAGKAQTGNFLQQAKLALLALQAQYGEDLDIPWENRVDTTLAEKLKELQKKKKEQNEDTSSASSPTGMRVS